MTQARPVTLLTLNLRQLLLWRSSMLMAYCTVAIASSRLNGLVSALRPVTKSAVILYVVRNPEDRRKPMPLLLPSLMVTEEIIHKNIQSALISEQYANFLRSLSYRIQQLRATADFEETGISDWLDLNAIMTLLHLENSAAGVLVNLSGRAVTLIEPLLLLTDSDALISPIRTAIEYGGRRKQAWYLDDVKLGRADNAQQELRRMMDMRKISVDGAADAMSLLSKLCDITLHIKAMPSRAYKMYYWHSGLF